MEPRPKQYIFIAILISKALRLLKLALSVNEESQPATHTLIHLKLEMWANAQRDGRPAEYRWCPVFNAAKYGWRTLLECRAVTLPRCESHWNLQGCPKLTKRSSPYYGDTWRRYCYLTTFFPIVDTCLSCQDIARQSCRMVPRWRLFGDFLRALFSASLAQDVSDLHSKFTLGKHPISDRWDSARKKKKKKKKKKKPQDENIHGLPYYIGRPYIILFDFMMEPRLK